MNRRFRGTVLLAGLLAGTAEGTEFPDLQLHGLADFRYFHADAARAWTDRDLGKFRQGGNNDRFRVNEAALGARANLHWDWSAHLTLKYADRQKNPLDLGEAFLLYRPVATSPFRFGARLGAFIPPLSLENTGTAWSSPYTLTSSAIDTWVGEELKTLGGEAQLGYQFDNGDKLGLFGAGFGGNDTAGTLLAWRGWSLHDYEATLNDRLPLPTRAGNVRTLFPLQSASTQPVTEVDGRPGHYAGLSLERPGRLKFRAVYYDNRARTSAIEDGQYAWHTRFWNLGFKLDLPWDSLLIGQGVFGRTRMGAPLGGRFPVDVDFHAWSLLFSKSLGPHRFSLRHDRFGSGGTDLLPQDDNRETGHAWTCNYNYNLHFEGYGQHQLNLEFVHLHSNRASRVQWGESARREENLWLVSYRWFF